MLEHPSSGDSDYVYADGMRIAKVTGYGGPSPTANYYIPDALGSTRLVTSPTGSVTFYDNYQPYGQDNAASGSDTYKFTGKPFSISTGLYYDYQRWYDPSIGRFISPDPSGGPNLYIYALNNPTRYVDPNGAAPIDAVTLFKGVLSSLSEGLTGLSFFTYSTARFFDGDFSSFGGSHFLINPPDIYNGGDHEIWVGQRDVFQRTRYVGKVVSKFDRPSLTQPEYHLRIDIGERQFHPEVPDELGALSEAFFDHPGAFGVAFLGVGLIFSGYDVWSAYQQGAAQGDRELTRQIFDWAGAIGGAEAGAAIGTALFPGVGTIIGGLAGGILGGLGGDWVANQLFNFPLGGLVYGPTPFYGKNFANPI